MKLQTRRQQELDEYLSRYRRNRIVRWRRHIAIPTSDLVRHRRHEDHAVRSMHLDAVLHRRRVLPLAHLDRDLFAVGTDAGLTAERREVGHVASLVRRLEIIGGRPY